MMMMMMMMMMKIIHCGHKLNRLTGRLAAWLLLYLRSYFLAGDGSKERRKDVSREARAERERQLVPISVVSGDITRRGVAGQSTA